jgi:hypothetical protein
MALVKIFVLKPLRHPSLRDTGDAVASIQVTINNKLSWNGGPSLSTVSKQSAKYQVSLNVNKHNASEVVAVNLD